MAPTLPLRPRADILPRARPEPDATRELRVRVPAPLVEALRAHRLLHHRNMGETVEAALRLYFAQHEDARAPKGFGPTA